MGCGRPGGWDVVFWMHYHTGVVRPGHQATPLLLLVAMTSSADQRQLVQTSPLSLCKILRWEGMVVCTTDHLRWHRKPSEMASDGQLAHLCIPNSPLRVLGKVGACLVLEVYEGLSRSRLGNICFFQALSYIMHSTRTSLYKKVNKQKQIIISASVHLQCQS